MAASGKLYAPPNITFLLQNERLPSSSEVLDSLWPHSTFPGSKSMVNYESVSNCRVRDRGFMMEKEEELVEEEYEACFHPQGKKRRLTSEQVQFLEKNFEVENKLEPERKVQLAKELGLHPRQVAIWFQNRRARFKTKQLEKDYAALKSTFDNLKSDYDALLNENNKLKQEMNSMKNREKEKDDEEEAVNSSAEREDFSEEDQDRSNNSNSGGVVVVPMAMCKREEANSEDGGGGGNHREWSLMEPADSSSEFSQDEEDNLMTSLPCFPKVEDGGGYDDHTNSSNHFGFPSVEDHTFCFWPY